MNRCNCGCDPDKPENCKFCWCVGNPSGYGAKQLCHCCVEVKNKNDQLKKMEINRHPERFAHADCRFCRGNGRFQTISGLCICVNGG